MNEQTIVFGGSRHLVGTITLPEVSTPSAVSRTAVLLTNAGVISRIGPRRMNVKLAARLARMGIPSLRWDMSGLGDSQRPRVPLGTRQQFVADSVDAMEEAGRRFGADSFIMVGFCSGAEIAFRLALQDQRLKAAVLFDHHIYKSRKGTVRWYRRRLTEIGVRALPATVFRVLKNRFVALRERVKTPSAESGSHDDSWTLPSLDEYAGQIRSLLDRDVKLFFLYSGVFPEVFNHSEQFAELYGSFGLPGRVSHDFLPDFDHLITAESAQLRFLDSVTRWIGQRVQPVTKE